MRINLTCIVLLLTLVQVSAASYAQKISLSKKNITLQELFKEIKSQSGYDFLYQPSELKNAKPVNIEAANTDLRMLLDNVFEQQSLAYAIDQNTIVVRKKNESILDKVVNFFKLMIFNGMVVGEDGEPLPGATVKVKNGTKAVITNGKGVFSISGVEENTILTVSFIGYKTKEVTVGNGRFLKIQMEPDESNLDAVMVTGYQKISKERATGSFSQVNREALDHRPVSNLSSALQGAVAGMQAKENADGSVDFLIRGNSTLYADRKPLVVVDGFPISNSDFSDINPNDVESVTVLKDAAAASIWGARAANGVIVVVTKKVKGNTKLKIDVSAFTRISNRVDLDQALTQANSADHVAYERKAFENNWVFDQFAGSFGDIYKSLTLAQELLYANDAGTLSKADMDAGLDRLSKISNRSQLQDLLMRKSVLSQYNINLQSGTDRSKTYMSLMYENNKGSFVKNGYDRVNLNFNNDFKISKALNFNISANLQYKDQESSGATIDEIQGLSPYELLLNPDGSYGTNLKDYNREQLGLIPYDKFTYSDWSYNLLREVTGRNLKSETLNARIQAGLNLKIVKGLTFDTKLQYERSKTDYNDYFDENTFFTRGLINKMTVYNDATKTVGKAYIPKGGILKGREFTRSNGVTYDVNNTDLESYLLRNQFNFDKNIGSKHSISVIAGMELAQYTTSQRANPYVYGYYGDKLQATTPPYGYGSSVDQFTDFEGGNAIVPGGNTVFDWKRDKFVSFYSNASYTYDNKYTLTGSIRSDASNFITDDPKLRWSPLWSVGAKWNAKNERFMDNIAAVDRLDIRLTYGKNGNVDGSTSTKALLNIGSGLNGSTGTITGTVSDNGNPFLRWEETTSTNFGIDFALLNNKLFGSIDLYNKRGEGIIGVVALPAATGTTSQKFNNASITNRGIEISLGTNIAIPNTSINYSTSFNYAYNYNNINSLYNPSLYVYQMIEGTFVEGRPVNAVYSFDYLGMKDGVPYVAGPNGTTQSLNDVTLYNRGLGLPFLNYEGTATPPHTLGWVNNIRVHDFNLTAIFVGKMGGVYRNPGFQYSTTVGYDKTFVNKYISDVLAGNPNVPGFGNPDETKLYLWDRYSPALSSLVESSSYIELKELTLEYKLSKKLAKAIQVNNVKIFAQTRDLGMIWHANSKGYNPDWLPGTNRPVQSYTFGVNLQF
ncbi:SusC/RagA family TonB-linked outer membrane protein [Pedobacter sp. ok626]|uniref:SusC/RagA family TonB-linked outer membrane protein n=1 Tax=Pedobacter sp. ok626 TaxID=1761882 RepID=UPI0014055155|nr:SusC/RagA family TonB-linked outer membrane protein [Pedobacter sp. ok626]